MSRDAGKRRAAAAALEYVPKGGVIGVGTGSTVDCFIDALRAHRHRIAGAVASSQRSAERLAAQGVEVLDLNAAGPIPVYIDGADEADGQLRLIKGGGGALTGEKIVAAAAETFVCIIDATKRVQRLGRFPLAVEVLPMARSLVARQLVALGGAPVYRSGFVTDHGNPILDVHHLDLSDPCAMERRINDLAGVVCNGLFALRPADVLLIGSGDAVSRQTRR